MRLVYTILYRNLKFCMMDTQKENPENNSRETNSPNSSPATTSDNLPDENEQNNTGFAGTTNSISENHQDKDGYEITIEDTMIGYDGDDEQMNMDIGDDNKKTDNTRGVGDND